VRTKSGRLSRSIAATRDFGTREAEVKRLAVVNGGDPALFSIPVDVAHAGGFLDRDQHTKATKFPRAWPCSAGRCQGTRRRHC
jgi:hypothetical protein